MEPNACDHGQSELFPNSMPLSLCVTNGWLRSYVRCFGCGYKEDIGWRWNFTTQGDGFKVWRERHEDAISTS